MYRYLSGKFRIACQFALALAAIASLASSCLGGADKLLYDVDFNGPPHVVGATPAFGFGAYPRKTPTAGGQIFHPSGSATVFNAAVPFINRPVELRAIDGTPSDPNRLGGANLEFDLNDPDLEWVNRYHASVDVFPANLRTASGLGIFFDASSIHSVQFMPDGNIRVRDATGLDQVIGQYFPETIYHVRMAFDKAAVTWSASINGVPIYHGPAHGTDMDRFRIAMTTGDTVSPSYAYFDNIRVSAVVPEPGTIGLAGLAVSGVLAFATRRRRRPRQL